jgi:hypothetical protein
MASRVTRSVVRTAAGVLVFGFVPIPAVTQSVGEPSVADEAERIGEDIRAASAEGGPRSPELIEPLTDLATLFEAEGDHAPALAALERAREVVRANYGLHSLDELPLMQQALENQRALGNLAMVVALEEEMLELAGRYPDDLRTVAVHRDIGMRQLDILRRLVGGEAPPEIYGTSAFSYSHWRSDVINGLVSRAQMHFAAAAAVIQRNGLHASDELRDLAMEIVRASDAIRQQRGWALSDRQKYMPLYWLGRRSYGRLIEYDEAAYGDSAADGPELRRRLVPYVQLSDWDLVYSANGPALEGYVRLVELIKTTRSAERLIAEIFTPEVPIVLPTFLPNPLATQPSARYIDVAFKITRYGESRNIDIVGATGDVADAAKDEVVSLIKRSVFRPRVADGEIAREAQVTVRYYLND